MIVYKNNYEEDERLFSTGDSELDDILEEVYYSGISDGYDYAQREFGNKANKAARKAWEKGEAKKLGDAIFNGTEGRIDLSPNGALRVFRLKQVADVHGGVGDVISSKGPSGDFRVASDAVLGKEERTINHKINSKSFFGHSDNPLGKVKHGDELVINDLNPQRNKERYEILRTGGYKSKKELENEAKRLMREEIKEEAPKRLENIKKVNRIRKIKKAAPWVIGGTVAAGATIAGVKAYKKKKNSKKEYKK